MATQMDERDTYIIRIFDRLGAIDGKLTSLAKLEEKVDLIEKRTTALEKFEGRVGAYIWLGGTIVSGVLFMLAEGLKYILSVFLHPTH